MVSEDFEKIDDIKEINIQPKGWREITIEYGLKKYGVSNSLLFSWKVKGTDLIFSAPLSQVYEDCQGNYEEHFCKVLELFWQDYVTWKNQGFPEPWMRKHKKQFSKLIFTY